MLPRWFSLWWELRNRWNHKPYVGRREILGDWLGKICHSVCLGPEQLSYDRHKYTSSLRIFDRRKLIHLEYGVRKEPYRYCGPPEGWTSGP